MINGGGVISVGAELWKGGWNRARVTEMVVNIGNTVARVLEESKKRSKFPEVVAVELAKERIQHARNRRQR